MIYATNYSIKSHKKGAITLLTMMWLSALIVESLLKLEIARKESLYQLTEKSRYFI